MKRIIILTTQYIPAPEDDPLNPAIVVAAIFRFAVPVAERVPRPDTSRSLYIHADDATEIAPLRTGAEVERLQHVRVIATATLGQMRAALVAAWTEANDAFQAEKPGRFFGAFYDGSWNVAP